MQSDRDLQLMKFIKKSEFFLPFKDDALKIFFYNSLVPKVAYFAHLKDVVF